MSTGDSQSDGKHNWLELRQYLYLHQIRAYEHSIVIPGQELELVLPEITGGEFDAYLLQGTLKLKYGLIIEVKKLGDLTREDRPRARSTRLRYNISFPGEGNLLRFDNGHFGQSDEYHRHEYDPGTLKEISNKRMTRAQFPVMHEILDEIQKIAEDHCQKGTWPGPCD